MTAIDSQGPPPRAAMEKGHSPGQQRPLGSYAVLTTAFLSAAGAFAAWFRRSGRPLPDTIALPDLALLTVGAHKLSRTITRDRVTSGLRAPFTRFQGDAGAAEVDEAARGTGMRRVIGELLVCPYCLGMWVSAAMCAMLLVAPRLTRWVAATLTIFFGTEVLQIAYSRAEDLLAG